MSWGYDLLESAIFYLSVAIERVTKSFNGETFVLYMKKENISLGTCNCIASM